MLTILILACGGSKKPASSPVSEPEPTPEAPAPAPAVAPVDTSGCAPSDVLAVDATGVCEATYSSWTEGDFFYVGLDDPAARFVCGRCDGCDAFEVGTPVRVHWKVQSIEIPEGSPAMLHPLVEQCEPR